MAGLKNFIRQNVLVVGDMMIDKYIIGTVSRISPEAPVPVLRQKEVQRKLGGTGNVILNIVSLGAKVRAVGRIGNDPEGRLFRQRMKDSGVDDSFIYDLGGTIVKTRVSANNQQFIRIDEEDIIEPGADILNDITSRLDELFSGITAVIISDYSKGFVSKEMAALIISAAQERGVPVFVDPKGKSAAKYRGATAMTPNTKELLDMTGLNEVPDENGIREYSLKLCRENDLKYLIYTRSEKGISVIDSEKGTMDTFPAVEKEVIDVTGAGDTVVAIFTLAMSAGFTPDECAVIANVGASVVISRFGTAQVTLDELLMNLGGDSDETEEDVFDAIESLRSQGRKIVFTNGCFDIVHAGHISSFRQARAFGDVLIVGLNSDESIKRIKGDKRPIVDLKNRLTLLRAIDCVDFVIPFSDDTPQALIERIRPDVLVKGADWQGKDVAGGDFVRSYGGDVKFIELEQGLSTTNIIEKIRSSMV